MFMRSCEALCLCLFFAYLIHNYLGLTRTLFGISMHLAMTFQLKSIPRREWPVGNQPFSLSKIDIEEKETVRTYECLMLITELCHFHARLFI